MLRAPTFSNALKRLLTITVVSIATVGVSFAEEADEDIFLDPDIDVEYVEVYNEKRTKPFKRDTELRLTGDTLKKQGVTNLAQALELLPDVYIRNSGRGGKQIDIRGARRGSIKVLLDGISISDPYYGNIDLSAIPVTDIEQIRVSSSPASPIDGIGGPGGVIEIHTKDAMTRPGVTSRFHLNTSPELDLAITGRTPLSDHWAARVSATALVSDRRFDIEDKGTTFRISENKEQHVAAFRAEYIKDERRLAFDAWMQHGSFVNPPELTDSLSIQKLDGESQIRLGLQWNEQVHGIKFQTHGYMHRLERASSVHDSPFLKTPLLTEDISAWRRGLRSLASRSIINQDSHVLASINFNHESIDTNAFDGSLHVGGIALLQASSGLQYQANTFSIDAAIGGAIPLNTGASPWPEYKFTFKQKWAGVVDFRFTSGYKGRTPTLRERFRVDGGNAKLGPEKALFNEVSLDAKPIEGLRLRATAYQRNTNGHIRFDVDQSLLINTGDLLLRGVDFQSEVALMDSLRLAGTLTYQNDLSETDNLDFFPKWRANGQIVYQKERWGGFTRINYVGDQIDRNEKIPWRSTVDVSANVQASKHWSLTARIENVGGIRYYVRNGVTGPGRTAFLTLLHDWK